MSTIFLISVIGYQFLKAGILKKIYLVAPYINTPRLIFKLNSFSKDNIPVSYCCPRARKKKRYIEEQENESLYKEVEKISDTCVIEDRFVSVSQE